MPADTPDPPRRSPQTLGEMRTLLAAHGLDPRHALGQNFLHDRGKLEKIIDLAALAPGDRVLEVGPGTGVLTELLLDRGARVLAVELDRGLDPLLRDRLDPFADRFELMLADVLESKHAINPAVLDRLGDEPFQLVANLPYQVASPLLAELATHVPTFTRGLAMVQREVADRLAASPGSKQYGPLTVTVQAQCSVRRALTLKPGCFFPPPKVDSAVVELVRRDAPLTADPDRLARLLQTLFSQRRKQLGRTLGRGFPWPEGVDPTHRPEQLDIATLESLAARQKD